MTSVAAGEETPMVELGLPPTFLPAPVPPPRDNDDSDDDSWRAVAPAGLLDDKSASSLLCFCCNNPINHMNELKLIKILQALYHH